MNDKPMVIRGVTVPADAMEAGEEVLRRADADTHRMEVAIAIAARWRLRHGVVDRKRSLAAASALIDRLKKAGRIRCVGRVGGRPAWRWVPEEYVGSIPPVARVLETHRGGGL